MSIYDEKQKKIRDLNDEWEYSIRNEIKCEGAFYLYEPFEIEKGNIPYWYKEPKVVFCNLNAYGERGEGEDEDARYDVSWNKFAGWMWKGKNNTIRQTAFFIYALLEKLKDENPLPEKRPPYDCEQMKKYMQRICYMNIYPFIHLDEKGDEEKAWEKISGKARNFYNNNWQARSLMRDMIAALEPDIFIITGVGGVKMLNRIYQSEGDDTVPDDKKQCRYTDEELNLDKWGIKRFVGTPQTLFVSIPHPSRGGLPWKKIVETVEKIKEKLPPKTENN